MSDENSTTTKKGMAGPLPLLLPFQYAIRMVVSSIVLMIMIYDRWSVVKEQLVVVDGDGGGGGGGRHGGGGSLHIIICDVSFLVWLQFSIFLQIVDERTKDKTNQPSIRKQIISHMHIK